jgi:chromosome segregation ATPase
MHEMITQAIEQKDDQYKALQIRIQTLQKSLEDTTQEERSLQAEIQKLRHDISTRETLVAKIDTQAFTAKKNVLAQLKNMQDELNKSIAHDMISRFAHEHAVVL